VEESNIAVINLLFASGASLVDKNPPASGGDRGHTALCAAYSRHYSNPEKSLEVLKLLIAHAGRDLDVLAGPAGCKLLDLAAAKGEVDIEKALLAGGAAPSGKGSEPLLAAAETGKVEVVRILLAAKANLNVTGFGGYTPLYYNFYNFKAAVLDPRFPNTSPTAVQEAADRVEISRLLLAAGAKVNTVTLEYHDTPLCAAIRNRLPVEIVKLLLAAGADPSARGGSGTPLSIATELNEPEIVALLRSAASGGRKE
jgi:ankyrin repeat protein